MQKKHYDLLVKTQDDEVLKFIDAMTTETLESMADDLKKYLEEEKPKEIPQKSPFDIPFSIFIKPIFGSLGKFNAQAKKTMKAMPRFERSSADAWNVARLKLLAQEKAKKDIFSIFNVYRKTNKMITPP